jgi:hypothetical protein
MGTEMLRVGVVRLLPNGETMSRAWDLAFKGELLGTHMRQEVDGTRTTKLYRTADGRLLISHCALRLGHPSSYLHMVEEPERADLQAGGKYEALARQSGLL